MLCQEYTHLLLQFAARDQFKHPHETHSRCLEYIYNSFNPSVALDEGKTDCRTAIMIKLNMKQKCQVTKSVFGVFLLWVQFLSPRSLSPTSLVTSLQLSPTSLVTSLQLSPNSQFNTPSSPPYLKQLVKWKSLSRVLLFETPWTTQSMEFSRPEYWSG